MAWLEVGREEVWKKDAHVCPSVAAAAVCSL